MGYDVQQESDGRWRWAVAEMGEHGDRWWLATGLVSFESKTEAQEDFDLHQKAVRNNLNRLVLSKDHVQRLVRALAQTCPSCDNTYFGGVYWHEPDEMGCNWSVSTMNGPDFQGCFDEIQAGAISLRQAYSIPDEG